jgi:trehalose 6-phosphate phosphatase
VPAPEDPAAVGPAPAEPGALARLLNEKPRPWLIGVDVDGTLAPIVDHPDQSRLHPDAIAALEALRDRVGVMVAVVSGRPLSDLRHKFGLPTTVMLLGSHGAEVGTEVDARTAEEQRLVEDTVRQLQAIVDDLPGAWIEDKPLAVALHVRQADPERGTAALAELGDALQGRDDIALHRGHRVLEIAVRPTTKRIAFDQLRMRLEPATTVFIGDDASDEKVFASLQADDVAVKVGPGATAAPHRLATPDEVVQFLAALAAME